MKYEGVCIAVKDVNKARKFYEELFGLEIYQDYGINISFTCGISLQQEFDWLLGVTKERILEKSHNMELYFEEDEFDSFIEKLEVYPGIEYLGKGVKEAEWGQRSVKFFDRDGHIIEVGENMKMVVRRFLNQGMDMAEVSKRMNVSIGDLEKLLNVESGI